jgi:hypothetical protein
MARASIHSLDTRSRAFLSPEEFSHLTGLSLASVRRYLKSGRLPCWQPRGRRGRILIPTHLALQALSGPSGAPACAASTVTAPSPAASVALHQPVSLLSGPRPKWLQATNLSKPLAEP